MPPITQAAVRAAMVYLVLGALSALAYWLNERFGFAPWLAALSPTYLHLIVVGWITQFIFAIAYWMFPVFSKTNPRGSPALAKAVFITLNAGLILRAVCEPWRTASPNALNGAALIVSSILQATSGVLFVWLMWPRVRERGGF
ncbi:MAG TPA: hypothetical protein PLJ62_03520 [Thermoflexales bacterium]|nr:hypothetical protein [Thermoflexales bacterium]HQW34412.1 hypothetical protein [Thermoflexales bacterium]HQZ21647.1 hypothetical protein [Thermoflexales bacterium]HQZ99246.1 hypothetical protein [Thermoflexales bacterium]